MQLKVEIETNSKFLGNECVSMDRVSLEYEIKDQNTQIIRKVKITLCKSKE